MNKKQRRAIEVAARILDDARGHYIGEVGVDGWMDECNASEADVSAGLYVIRAINDALEAGNVEWTPDNRLRIDEIAIDFEDV